MSDDKMIEELEEKLAEGITADELIELAEKNGIEVTDEMRSDIADRFAELAEEEGIELDDEVLDNVAGGKPRIRLSGPRRSPFQTIKDIIDLFKRKPGKPTTNPAPVTPQPDPQNND